MATIIVWRTDREVFEPGTLMPWRGDHIATLDSANKDAELALRAAMTDGHNLRANSLYTWRDEDWARSTWQKQPTDYLYKLEVEESDIRHTGDLCYYTEIREALARNGCAAAAIRAYATGADFIPERHFKPRVEILVGKPKILERFSPPPT